MTPHVEPHPVDAHVEAPSLPTLRRLAEDVAIATEQLVLQARRLRAHGVDPTVAECQVIEAAELLRTITARLTALGLEVERAGRDASRSGGDA